MVAEGSLFRKKGTAVNAGCSRVQCLFKSSSSSLCLGKEPLHTVAHWGMLPGADTIIEALAHLRPGGAREFCHGLGSILWAAHDSLCSEAMSKKHVHLMAERRGTERSMPTNKASCIINCFNRIWPFLTLNSWFAWDYTNSWDCRNQETNWGIVLPAPL